MNVLFAFIGISTLDNEKRKHMGVWEKVLVSVINVVYKAAIIKQGSYGAN